MLTVLVVILIMAVAIGVLIMASNNARNRPPFPHTPPQGPMPHPQDLSDAALMELIRRGRKIEAIKRIRERSGIGLKEAKDIADAMEAGLMSSAPHVMDPRFGSLQIDLGHVQRLLNQNGRDAAISYVAAQTSLDSEEAEYYISVVEKLQTPQQSFDDF